MRFFSERFGLTPKRVGIQVDSIDDALRVGVWNDLSLHYFKFIARDPYAYGPTKAYPTDELKLVIRGLWQYYFKLPLDTLPAAWDDIFPKLREYFFGALWNEVYDFTEFFARGFPLEHVNEQFRRACNQTLERELSAYRFVGANLVRVTEKQEVEAIEEGMAMPHNLRTVSNHLESALRLLADRRKPDYRNSIKESISAVEAICSLVTSQDKADLSAALRVLEGKAGMHKALRSAFNSLYGYTSDSDGIRHALLEESTITHDDAKFMLVACSAFVSYVKARVAGAGVTLKSTAG
jgi:hypothetical protein